MTDDHAPAPAAVAVVPLSPMSHMSPVSTPGGAEELWCCPNCGWQDGGRHGDDNPQLAAAEAALADARQQIADLQAQVKLLNQKAAAAVDRWADYEDELSKLRAANASMAAAAAAAGNVSPPATAAAGGNRSSFLPAGAGARLSALLSPRKSTPNLRSSQLLGVFPASPSPPSPLPQTDNHALPTSPTTATGLLSPATADPQELVEALERETALRRAAEGRLSATSREVEELSVSLFEQANEMVAAERRARHTLEQRVQVLEQRDADKKRRLDRLEAAVGRIERVRGILAETGGIPVQPTTPRTAAAATESARASRDAGVLSEKGKVAGVVAVNG